MSARARSNAWKRLAHKLKDENRRQKRLLGWILCRIAQLPSSELATIEQGWNQPGSPFDLLDRPHSKQKPRGQA